MPQRSPAAGPITWLHLSDLHAGAPGLVRWHRLEVELERDIRRMVELVGAPDLILFTGDLSFSGEEFERVDRCLEQVRDWIREAARGSAEPLLFAVPGNHDVQRPAERQQHAFLVLDDYDDDKSPIASFRAGLWEDRDTTLLDPLFRNYQTWMSHAVVSPFGDAGHAVHTSFFPGDLSAVFERDGFRLGLVGLNSAWAQYRAGDFKGQLLLAAQQLHAALPDHRSGNPLRWFKNCDRTLLLMHHPPDWLSERSRTEFDGQVYPPGSFDLCLFGHVHKARSELVSIAGGRPRPFFQSHSLFGLEEFGSHNERRAVGYAFGRISADGFIRVWPRKVVERGSGNWAFDRDSFFEEHEDGATLLASPIGDPAAAIRFFEVLQAHRSETLTRFHDEESAAKGLSDAGEFARAEQSYAALLRKLESVSEKDNEQAELRTLREKTRLNLAGCVLSQQEVGRGRRLLLEVDASALPEDVRASLARALANVDEPERARAVLPDSDVSEAIAGARLHIEVAHGEMPSELPDDERLLSTAAQRLAGEGALARATELARRGLRLSERRPPWLTIALGIEIRWLDATVHEQRPLDAPIQRGRRQEVLDRIDELLRELRDALLPHRLRERVLVWELSFAGTTADIDRLEAVRAELLEHGWTVPLTAEGRLFERAMALAADSRLEEALETLSEYDTPWVRPLQEAQLLLAHGDFDEGLRRLRSLAQTYRGRAPIEFALATALLQADENDAAVEHAERAYQELPGRGYRLLLAQCLLRSRADAATARRAWELLEPLLDSPYPSTQRTLGLAAARAEEWGAADEILAGYLDSCPDDAFVRLERARVLAELGNQSETAEVAWQAATLPGHEELSAEALGRAGLFQTLDGRSAESERQRRMREIAQRLRQRFPGDPTAEAHRLELLTRAGFPEDEPAPDMALLVESGFLSTAPLQDVVDRAARQQRRAQHAWRLYRKGHLPFESLCELTGLSPAAVVVRFGALRREPVFLSAPLRTTGIRIVEDAPAAMLLSDLELLVLRAVGLLDVLAEDCRAGTKLLLFRDVDARVAESAQLLEALAERARCRQLQQLRRWLDRAHPTVQLHEEKPEKNDVELAAELEIPIAHHERPAVGTWIPPSWLVEQLRLEGANADSLRSFLAEEDAPPAPPFADLPDQLMMTSSVLFELHAASALDDLLEALAPDARVHVGPETIGGLRDEIRGLDEAASAADAARELWQWLAVGKREGWLEPIERPEPLLPPMQPTSEDTPFAAALKRAWAYYQAIVQRTEPTLLLTADHFVASWASGVTPPLPILLPLGCQRESFEAALARYLPTAAAQVYPPDLVASWEQRGVLTKDGSTAAMRQLVDLGFQQALRSDDIVGLVRRYGSLTDDRRPREFLDRAEWLTREAGHPARALAVLALATVYTDAIWRGWCGRDQPDVRRPDLDPVAFTDELLRRIEAMDEGAGARAMDILFRQFAAKSVDRRWDFVATRNEDSVTIGRESPAGRLWDHLARWARRERVRRGAFSRAVIETLAMVDEGAGEDEPPEAAVLPMVLAGQSRRSTGGAQVLEVTAEREALALLSANWSHKPLGLSAFASGGEAVGIEDALDQCTAYFRRHDMLEYAARFMTGQLPESWADRRLLVPLDAVLLRCDGETIRKHAPGFAAHRTRHDGRAREWYRSLAEAPTNILMRRRIAREMVLAPWLQIRDDPLHFASWAHPFRGLKPFPANLEDLRELLSEPGPLPDGDISVILVERGKEGGAWSRGPEWALLSDEAARLPLHLSVALPLMMAANTRDVLLRSAVEVVRGSAGWDRTSAELAMDIVALRLQAAQEPVIEVERSPVDLRQDLPALLLRLLKLAMSPPSGTIAANEPPLLRLCSQNVRLLAANRGERLPHREELWLAYRLFNWLTNQLRHVNAARLELDLADLAKVAPPPVEPDHGVHDALNPLWLGPERYDLRVASALYAIAMMDHVIGVLVSAGTVEPVALKRVNSDELEELLLELATRESTPVEQAIRALGEEASALGVKGPATVPDLALLALLNVNSRAFLRLTSRHRIRILNALPPATVGPALPTLLAAAVMEAVTTCATELGPRERVLLRDVAERVEAADSAAAVTKLRLLIALLLAGERLPEGSVQALLAEHLGDKQGTELVGRYFLGVAEADPSALDASVEALLEAARTTESGPVPYAATLGRVVLHGSPAAREAAKAILRRLDAESPYRENDVFQNLVTGMNLK